MSDNDKPLETITARLTPEMGADLFAAALRADNDKRGKYVIAQMAAEIEGVRQMQGQIEALGEIVRFRNRRILALQAGEFQIGRNDSVVYDDPTLRGKTIETPDGTHFI